MGYETKMYVGEILGSRGNRKPYFIKIANVDLCKCNYDGPLAELITKATNRECSPFQDVEWSESFRIDQQKVSYEISKKGIDITTDDLETIIETCEGWECKVDEDKYGSPLRAVPFNQVLEALEAQMKYNKEKGEKTRYRRYVMAQALLKSMKKGFDTDELFVVLFGY